MKRMVFVLGILLVWHQEWPFRVFSVSLIVKIKQGEQTNAVALKQPGAMKEPLYSTGRSPLMRNYSLACEPGLTAIKVSHADEPCSGFQIKSCCLTCPCTYDRHEDDIISVDGNVLPHTHRGSCGWAVNHSFSPGMVWVSLQILQSLVGLGTLNPFSPSPLFTGLCLTLCGMLLYRDLSPTRSMHWKVGEACVCVCVVCVGVCVCGCVCGCGWVRNGKKVVHNGCVLRWKYRKPTCSPNPLRIWKGNGCHCREKY